MKAMKHPLLLASAMLALATTCSNAATLLSVVSNTSTNTHSGTIGMVFTVGASDLSVTSLGFHDLKNDTGANVADGLTVAHTVGIWNNAGTLIASATIQAGTASTLDGAFRYESIAPVLLLATQSYTIGAMFNGGSDRYISANTPNNFAVINPADATGGQGVYDTDTNMATRPTLPGGQTMRWVASNMKYDVVPEPSAALLGGLGVLALLRRRRA